MAAKKQSVYSKIAENIISKIKSGEYNVGGMLPPERVLMDIYKVERTTVRRGLELLSRDGYIKKVAGLGSVIISENAAPTQAPSSGNEPQAAFCKQPDTEKNSVSILALFPEGEKSSSLSEAVTEQLKDICRKHGAKLAVLSSSDPTQVLDAVKKNHAKSCAVFFGTDESIIDTLNNEGINTCFVFCTRKGERCILPDIHLSCDSAAEYLSSLGHSSAAFIGGDEDSYLERELRLSFSDEFTKRNPESDIKQYTNTGGSDEKSGFERLSELIRRAGGKFTAVAAVNDEVALGALKAAKYYRLSVPEDLSIISLCSTDKGCEADGIYTNPAHIAMEIYNRCSSYSKEAFGVTSTFEAELLSGKTSGRAKNSQSSGRRLSDFLL